MFRFFVCLILMVLFIGCQEMTKEPLMDIISENKMTGIQEHQKYPVCQVGDILMPGQSCVDDGTDAMFTVLPDGNGKYTSKSGLLFESTDILDTRTSTLNDQSYDFLARKLEDGTWIIEQEDPISTQDNAQ